jgi:hypothetical protein
MVKTEEKGKQRREGRGRDFMVKILIHLMRNALELAKCGPTYKKLTQHIRSSQISNSTIS